MLIGSTVDQHHASRRRIDRVRQHPAPRATASSDARPSTAPSEELADPLTHQRQCGLSAHQQHVVEALTLSSRPRGLLADAERLVHQVPPAPPSAAESVAGDRSFCPPADEGDHDLHSSCSESDLRALAGRSPLQGHAIAGELDACSASKPFRRCSTMTLSTSPRRPRKVSPRSRPPRRRFRSAEHAGVNVPRPSRRPGCASRAAFHARRAARPRWGSLRMRSTCRPATRRPRHRWRWLSFSTGTVSTAR